MTETIITQEWIAKAEAAGACEDASEWLRQRPRSLRELAGHPEWLLWAYGYMPGARQHISEDTVRRCALTAPRYALKFAAEHLPPDLLAECARGALGCAQVRCRASAT